MDFERLLILLVMIVVVFSALVIIAIFVELLLEFLKLRHQKEGNTTYVIVDKNQTVNNTIVNNEVNNEEVVEESNNGVEIETQEEHKPVLTLPEKRLIVAKGANKVYLKPFPPLYDGVPRKANVKVSIGNTVEENITVNLKVNGETTKSVSTSHKKIEVKH